MRIKFYIPKWFWHIPYLLLVTISTWLKVFSSDVGLNYLLVSALAFSAFGLFTSKCYRNVFFTFIIPFLVLLLMTCFSYTNTSHWRASTLIYTSLFFIGFTSLINSFSKSYFTRDRYFAIIRFLIYCHFFAIVIQQLCLLVGVNEPINYTQSMQDFGEYQLRINGLTPEPSHVARFMLVLMFSYLVMKQSITGMAYDFIRDWRQDKYIWFAFFWSMLTIGSTTGLLFVGLIMLPLLSRKNTIWCILILGLVYMFVSSFDTRSTSRISEFLPAVLTGDLDAMYYADPSGSSRIIPIILILKYFSLDYYGWFGHGVDSNIDLIAQHFNLLPEGWSGGGLFTLLYEYGIIVFMLFWIMIFKCCYSAKAKLAFGIIVAFILIQPLNTQITWCAFMFLASNKYFLENKRTI